MATKDGVTVARKVDVCDESVVPGLFVRQERIIQKAAILKHFNDTGEVVPGVEIITDNTHLRTV